MAIARLQDFLEETRDDKIRTQLRLEGKISELENELLLEREKASLWQGRYEGAVKANEALKRDVEFHREQKEIYRWWLEDNNKRSRDMHLRLMQKDMEISALKDAIDALANELGTWYWH